MYMDGPVGRFEIPDEPPATRAVCEAIAREVWRGEYAHPELPAKASRILDIGAGWGAFTVWAMAQYPDAIVDCYEPHAAACEYLRRNAPKATVHEVAVTVQAVAILSVGDHDNFDNWGARTIYGSLQGDSVAVLHPKDLPPCDILKIDAEMVELEIAENYPHWDGVQALLYEFHTAEQRVALRKLAASKGFRLLREVEAGRHSDSHVWGPSVWVRESLQQPTFKDPADIYTLGWFHEHAAGIDEYRRVADVVQEVLPSFGSVVDVGCGPAFALARLQELGHEVLGIEGSVHALSLSPIKDKVRIADITLAKAKHFGQFDLVVCTEVAEHIEAVHANQLVDLLSGLAKTRIYFTAAPPGQGGTDHVNEQPAEYWIAKFEARGWRLDQALTDRVRQRLREVMRWQFWYAASSLVFDRA